MIEYRFKYLSQVYVLSFQKNLTIKKKNVFLSMMLWCYWAKYYVLYKILHWLYKTKNTYKITHPNINNTFQLNSVTINKSFRIKISASIQNYLQPACFIHLAEWLSGSFVRVICVIWDFIKITKSFNSSL